MKFNYTNILLFSFPLNILVNTQKNTFITHHTQTNRSLCECEVYAPANYDNDSQMKKVIDNFNKLTQQRFNEYDDRMVEKRKNCKDKCDKEIQKIILKDKLEKQMVQQFATLQTDIQSDAIPTCVCEKSIADKMEKGCLRCGGVLGGGVMPGFGAIGGTALYALNHLKPAVFKAAINKAITAGAAEISTAGAVAGKDAGMKAVIFELKLLKVDKLFPQIFNSFVDKNIYTEVTNIANTINSKYSTTCTLLESGLKAPAECIDFQLKLGIHKQIGNRISTYGIPSQQAIRDGLNKIAGKATQAAEGAAEIAKKSVTTGITEKETVLLEAGFNNSITSIYASIIAIVVIVLIMVIIYLILRYRRKKKMKKKLQYIKLLKE
ncbi:PIR protein, putative [Plasmodium sp.]|nr:PIR protein, putative [Plasmodium sp.]